MEEEENYEYESKEQYSEINKKIVSELQLEKEEKQNRFYYTVNLEYYNDYEMYYITIPQNYLDQIEELRKRKEDIFAKGKILTFEDKDSDFHFDAVVDSTEEEIYAN